jgi:DNA-binding NtrC family response regulator
MNWPNGKLPHLLMVDDDPIFSLLMAAQARTQEVPLTLCSNVEEMKKALEDGKYDGIVLDYYLGDEIGTDLANLVGPKIPIILVSHSGVWIRDCEAWPANITKFVHKNQGVAKILDTALTALRHDRPRIGPESPTERPFF